MSQTPKFESNIPDHLLIGVSPTDKWLMEEISRNTQATEYLLTKREEDSTKLDRIEEQCKKTNGRVTKLEDNVSLLNKFSKNLEGFSKCLSFVKTYAMNKYALIASSIFIYGCIKVAINQETRDLVIRILGF